MSNSIHTLGAQLASETIGCRIKFSWLGSSRSLDDNQQAETAALFSADADFIKASKRLFDVRRPEFKAVNRVKNSIRHYWQSVTLPYVEPGVRLLKRSNVAEFAQRIDEFTVELVDAVDGLQLVYAELLDEARARLGSLYNAEDYPATLRDQFAVSADYPNLSAPDYLVELSPELYRRESERVSARFAEAVELAEQAFAGELLAIVERITSTLSGADDGKPKVFRDTMVNNVEEFLQRFKNLHIGGSDELDRVVQQCEAAMRGVTPAALRSSGHVRDMVRESMTAIQTQLEAAVIDRPSRRIKFTTAPLVDVAAEPAERIEAEPVQTVDVFAETTTPPSSAVELVEPIEAANVESVAVDVEAETEPAEPVDVETEPAGVVFNLNYGGGNVRRLVIPSRSAC